METPIQGSPFPNEELPSEGALESARRALETSLGRHLPTSEGFRCGICEKEVPYSEANLDETNRFVCNICYIPNEAEVESVLEVIWHYSYLDGTQGIEESEDSL